MSTKKIIIIISTIVILIALAIEGYIILNKKEQENAKNTFLSYIEKINNKEYENLYENITQESKEKISEEDFINRNKNIYEGIEATNIKVEIQNVEKENGIIKISYKEQMDTEAGKIDFENTANVIKDKNEYKIQWSSSMIFPELRDTDKVRIQTLKASRGKILDRNGKALAEDGSVSSVGIVPGKLGENKEENIKQIADLLEVTTEGINSALSASYVKEDTFVPIKKVSKTNTELKEKLLQIPGIKITDTEGRVYSLGKEAGHLIGYVQAISAEELEAKQGQGYTASSIIGKTGLEQAYEETLRGTDGSEIYIEDEEGNKLKQLAKQDLKNGTDIKLTIDSEIQQKLYNELQNDKGFFVVMEPKTGELLAAVSTPTYDSNDFVLGMTTLKWNALSEDESRPLYNRFLQRYCPGSTFKAVTGAIALTTGKVQKDQEFSYTGTSWKKDESWGNYEVTTLTAYTGAKNLLNAIMHSDNIYFAQATLAIGAEEYEKNLQKIGFNEKIDFPLELAKSQYSNEENISSEIKLADTGYGQGDLLVNPIHMASIYSAFVNNGNMIKPYIEYKEDKTPTILKENAFTSEAANVIKEALIQVVENPEGSANDAKVSGITVAGKTGTAELKTSRDDTQRNTLGWFDCFTINRQEGDLLIIGMVEDANINGGSHYLISKIKSIL